MWNKRINEIQFKSILIIFGMFIFLLSLGSYYYFIDDKPFVPTDYKSPSITSAQAEQYRAEEQSFYDEIKYEGGINMEEEKVFQGPVPEGYDEEHFRKTGETILLGDTNGK